MNRIETQEFVERELKNFVEKYPMFRVRYEYNDYTGGYLVEVSPGKIFYENGYMESCLRIANRFDKRFSWDLLCFITDDYSYASLERIDFCLCGKEYVSDDKTEKA